MSLGSEADQADLPEIDSLWEYINPAESESRFRHLLPRVAEIGGNAYLAELFTQIARAEGLQGRFDDAAETLARAEALLTPETTRARVRWLLEKGRVLNSSGNSSESRPLFLDAFETVHEAGEEFLAIDAAHMLGIVEPAEKQLEWNLRALEMAQTAQTEKARGWQGSLHNNIGWTYHELGRFNDALGHFRAGLDWQRSNGKEREARIASWTVGRCLRSLGRIEEALALQRTNLQAAEAAGSPDGFIEEELGECLYALGNTAEAREHFAHAHRQLSQDSWLLANEPQRLERLERLSR